MKRHDLMALALAGTLTFSLLAGCNQTEAREDSGNEVGETQAQSNGGDSTGALTIAEQGDLFRRWHHTDFGRDV